MVKRLDFDSNDLAGKEDQPIFFEFDSQDGILKEGSSGYGEISYPEGSVYRGSLIFHNGKFEKYGFGEQNFLKSTIECEDIGGPDGGVLYKFIGYYDYRKTQWICGNGILYFLDKKGNPLAFCKGFFNGTDRVGNWRGSFDNDLLLPGFEPVMEIPKLVRHKRRLRLVEEKRKRTVRARNVMIGDSWFEFFEEKEEGRGVFTEECGSKDVLNLGIGGSTYEDWLFYAPRLLSGLSFDRVFINLGFNDLHRGYRASRAFHNFIFLSEFIFTLNPKAEIYVNAICPSATFPSFRRSEIRLNRLISQYVLRDERMHFIECDRELKKVKDAELKDYFIDDGLHLNRKGYERWSHYFTVFF